MDNELQNDQDDLAEIDQAQINICPVCKMNPCVCSQENSVENSKDNEKPISAKKPKISWI